MSNDEIQSSFEIYKDYNDIKQQGINAFNLNNYEVALDKFNQIEVDSETLYYLACIYFDKNSRFFDIEKAYLNIIGTDFSKGGELANNIGKCFYTGIDCQQDYKKAFNCFKRAGELGNDKALFNIAVCYKLGNGVEKDISTACTYYKKSADAGNVKAMFNYANFCMDSNLEIYNQEEGFSYMLKAAENNHVEAQYKVGMFYYKGNGTPISFVKSIEWLDKAIANGSNDAYFYKESHFNKKLDFDDDCALELDDLDEFDD